jgi:hypothetical protein
MKTISKTKKGRKKGLAITAILLGLVIFVVIVMVMNSVKPDRLTLGKLEKNVRGAAFLRVNQILVKQLSFGLQSFWTICLISRLESLRWSDTIPGC